MRTPTTPASTLTDGHGSRQCLLRQALALLWLGTAPLAWAGAGLQLESALPALPPAATMAATALPAEPEKSVSPRPLTPKRRIAQPGGNGKKDGNAGPAPEVLLLDVTVNTKQLKDVVRVEQLPGGPLLIPVDAWTDARLLPPAQSTVLGDGTPAYPLSALPGVTYSIDRQKQRLDITAPATAFVATTLSLHDVTSSAPPRPDPGVMLNYDVAATHGGSLTTGGAALEAVIFSPLGNVVATGLVNDTGHERYATRLDTYWRYDMPHRMESLVVGDAVGASGGWSQPARFGGIRWGRDFGLRPGFVTYPQFSLSGQAALPSTVEVLVNNVRQSSRPVQPGPFDVTNVPMTSGAGEVNLVVRDLLGRETVIQQSYYAAPNLLAAGLTDFSFEAGWLRTGYGRETAYDNPFGAATWRQGLSNSLTGEARLEAQADRQAAGVTVGSLLGTWGVGYVALATSSGKTQGPPESGQLVRLGIERSTPLLGGSLLYEQASRGFAPFGEAVAPLAASLRARERWFASLSGTLWGALTGGASYVKQTRWDGERVQGLGASLSLPLWQRAFLSASVNKRLDGDKSWRASVNLNYQLDNGIATTATVDRGTDGNASGTVSAQRPAPMGPGLGWRVQAATTESQRAGAALQYNTNYAEFGAVLSTDAAGQVATRVGARGTVGRVDQMFFTSRPVGGNSVAVVKVEDMAGVPVMRANQIVAVTDARGLAFVPDLLPWQQNQITIDPVNLPMDVDVTNTTQNVTPYARTGVVVNFGARRSRQATLVLRQADGTPVPVGAKVRLLPAGPEFIAGRRGEIWLTDLAETTQRVQVSWDKRGCTLTLEVPASPDGTPGKIGPLACVEGKL